MGRNERIVWQPHVPVFSYTMLAVTAFCAIFFLWENYSFQQPAIRRAYTVEYLRASVGAQFKQYGKYRLLMLGGPGTKERPAMAADFTKGTTAIPDGTTIDTMLSDAARKQGFTFFQRGPALSYSDATMCRWLRERIFKGKSLFGVYTLPIAETVLVFVVGLAWAVPRDIHRLRELKYGRRLKGSGPAEPRAFNREERGGGAKTSGSCAAAMRTSPP